MGTRLTSVDRNRIVRPLEWGIDWSRDGHVATAASRESFPKTTKLIFGSTTGESSLASDEFFSYIIPRDFSLEHREVQVFSTRAECPISSWRTKFGELR